MLESGRSRHINSFINFSENPRVRIASSVQSRGRTDLDQKSPESPRLVWAIITCVRMRPAKSRCGPPTGWTLKPARWKRCVSRKIFIFSARRNAIWKPLARIDLAKQNPLR